MKNIIQISAAHLGQQEKFSSSKTTIHFNDCTFKKGVTFPLYLKEKALKYCQKKSQNNLKCLLVEYEFVFIVWNEEIASSEKLTITNNSSKDQSQSLSNNKSIQAQKISSKNLDNIEAKIPTKKNN